VNPWREILEAVEKILAEGRRAAIATVVRSIGSTPRHEGAKMLVGDDGTVVGTVGGGCPEAEVFDVAREVMATGRPRYLVLRYNEKDNPDGMICGGEMHLFVEPVMERRFYIFGGGHVSRAVARLCEFLGVPYVVAGTEEHQITPERFAGARKRLVGPWEEILPKLDPTPDSGVFIATRSHQEDERCLRWAAHRELAYLALLGSETKRKKLLERLARQGIAAPRTPLRCPAGLEIAAETPEEIAVSVMAEWIGIVRGADR
jgi:xanthine dehydrogenase accessory factor